MGKKGMKLIHRGQGGFTLVEVLITITLLGFIALAFFSFMSAATSSLIHADERTIAESLARSQLEYAKNQAQQDYQEAPPGGEVTYQKVTVVPDGYTVQSVNRDGEVVDDIVGIPWDTDAVAPANVDEGLQIVALVIKHGPLGEEKTIYTFVNDNDEWADGVEITLEGYVRQP
jgi:prepilin-type N-terminal cleavage/methylation domain-containing protein